MRKFSAILAKELKEIIRDPRLFLATILIPILLFPLMGVAASWAIRESAKSVSVVQLHVLNLDGPGLAEKVLSSESFRQSLLNYNITFSLLNATDEQSAIEMLMGNNTALIVIPENFTELIESGVRPRLRIHFFTLSTGFEQARIQGAADTFVDEFNKAVSEELISSLTEKDPDFLRDPINVTGTEVYTYIKGVRIKASPGVIFGIMFISMFGLPLIFLMLISTAVQFLATSIASEKEQKTLEILLTLPVKRETVLFAKLASSTLITILGTIGFFLGYMAYTISITSAIPASEQVEYTEILQVSGVIFSGYNFALLLAVTFLSFIASLALIIPVATLVEDVRSAQMLTSYVLMPFLLPVLFIAMFAPMLGAKVAVPFLFIPFTSAIAAALLIQAEKTSLVLIAIPVLLAETYFAVRLAVWFYGSEKVITARLAFGRKKREASSAEQVEY